MFPIAPPTAGPHPVPRAGAAVRRITLGALMGLAIGLPPATAAEILRVTHDNYAALVPAGKETDAIVGDWVLRNDRVVAVVADCVEGRAAHLTLTDAAGSVIDFTSRTRPNDQLTAFIPGGGEFAYRKAEVVTAQGAAVVLRVTAEPTPKLPVRVVTEYTLADGTDHITVRTTVTNPRAPKPAGAPPAPPAADSAAGPKAEPERKPAPKPDGKPASSADGKSAAPDAAPPAKTKSKAKAKSAAGSSADPDDKSAKTAARPKVTAPHPDEGVLVRLGDKIRADTTFAFHGAGDTDFLWCHDRHWEAAYGLLFPEGKVRLDPKRVANANTRSGSVIYWLPPDAHRERPDEPEPKSPTGEAPRPVDLAGYTLLPPGAEVGRTRLLLSAPHHLALRAQADTLRKTALRAVDVTVADKAGAAVAGAEVDVFDAAEAKSLPADEPLGEASEVYAKDGAGYPKAGGPAPKAETPTATGTTGATGSGSTASAPVALGWGRTDAAGVIRIALPPGKYVARIRDHGRPGLKVPVDLTDGAASAPPDRGAVPVLPAVMEVASALEVVIVDEQGRPCPAKIRLDGVARTRTPDFGPESAVSSVRNLVYTATGSATRTVDAGVYDVLVSRGPEFDAVRRQVRIRPGQTTALRVALRRSVRTDGWVSADLHNHSTISGDNTGSTEGRLLNLVCEGVEFAPCTEHNRTWSYRPHLAAMGLTGKLATSDGIELTGRPLPLNHQNAFPLKWRPREQNGGGPVVHPDPEVQIARLAGWDGTDKLLQINHPDIGWMFHDRNGDGTPDGGYAAPRKYGHVIEVWEPLVFTAAFRERTVAGKTVVENNRFFNWLQQLNQGTRVFAVANTDAHYNFHGSGWIRNWVRSSTDDVAAIDEAEMVRNFRAGRVVMSNGPFLEAGLRPARKSDARWADPGEDVAATGGAVEVRIRVQCPDWLDVDRVVVLVNGRVEKSLDFRRATHAALFGDGAVKFDWTLPHKLAADAHIIVVAIGEGSQVGPVLGDRPEPPLAVSNPIFVDVDGNGFQSNGDTLGHPLPVRRTP